MNLSKKQIQDLKDNKISIEDLDEKHFINSKYKIVVDNILKLLNNDICSFREIVDKIKSMKDEDDDPSLYRLLENKEFFEELFENNRLNRDDLRYLLNKIDKRYELRTLSKNTSLLKFIVDNELFKELVDKFKSIKDGRNDSYLDELLENKEFFEGLIENNKLTRDDLRYLLNKIDDAHELSILCENTSLLMKVLNEFILNKEDIDKFNRKIENSLYKINNIYTIFDLIKPYNYANKEILNLNELNRKLYILNIFELNEEQKVELIEVLRDNEQAQNRLIQIVDNNLQDQYDFESLKNLLTKDNDKNLKTKFNF